MVRLLYIDLYCGAGGTSTGVNSAFVNGEQCAKVIACVNHDANAIASHASNHPEALHFTEDIRTLELGPLVEHLHKCRKQYPGAAVVLWASLECTNFSKAKGGMPRDADSRTLAEHLFRYIDALDPDYIQIENVEEFMSWGDMDEKGHPIDMDKGRLYLRWVGNVKKYGYEFEHRILNSADYGAYTSRKRFFGIFAKEGYPIEWPEQTHSKYAERDLFSSYEKWKPVRDVLDFEDAGSSIFTRKKSLSEKTLERIYAGLIKFVAGGEQSFLTKYYSTIPSSTATSVDSPCGVVTTHDRFAIVQTSSFPAAADGAFLLKYNSTNQMTGKHIPPGVEAPCPTVACQNRLGLVQTSFLSKQFGGNPSEKNISVDGPAGTVTCIDHHAMVSFQRPWVMDTSYSNVGFPIDAPSNVVTASHKWHYLMSPQFLDMQYGNGTPASLDRPAGTVTTSPKHNLVTVKREFLMNPQFDSAGGSVDDPCFTLIARMDKRPPYLVTTQEGDLAIEIYPTDSPMTVKIKEFMALYCIVDIYMRMLKVSELKQIMGFPKDYVLIGTKAEQKKYIGNAVEVGMARVLCIALALALAAFHFKEVEFAESSS